MEPFAQIDPEEFRTVGCEGCHPGLLRGPLRRSGNPVDLRLLREGKGRFPGKGGATPLANPPPGRAIFAGESCRLIPEKGESSLRRPERFAAERAARGNDIFSRSRAFGCPAAHLGEVGRG